MLVRNASYEDLQAALNIVNEHYGGNVQFLFCRPAGYTRGGSEKHNVRLRVLDRRGPGAQHGLHRVKSGERRRTSAACWHVHGTFFDALPTGAEIRLSQEGLHRPGDPWRDRQVGSLFDPVYFSDLCDCRA